MKWTPHYFQKAGIDHAVAAGRSASRGFVQLYASPTGSGKSVVQLLVQEQLGWPIVTPRIEIVRGFLDKHGVDTDLSLSDLVDVARKHNIWTPIRFRNALFRGEIPDVPGIIVDEAHHLLAETWHQFWVASGMPPMLLYTATPFRGTPRSTAKFRELYGEPLWLITLKEAAEQGYIRIPEAEILPLVDDDLIEINASGDFDVTSIEDHTMTRLDDLAAVCNSRFVVDGHWDRPTCFAVPSVKIAHQLAHRLQAPTAVVTANTKDTVRRIAFEGVRQSILALIQINVISEGVDLPIRRLIDLAPRMSPVAWLQQFGRCTRPWDQTPHYLCTNRNLLRHAYLLEGMIPAGKIAEAQTAFGPSERASHRAIGLESLGRFKAVNIELSNGLIAQLYIVIDRSDKMTEYACICHPMLDTPIWASRKHAAKADGTKGYGRWQRASEPPVLQGFVSQYSAPVSEKQLSWWQRQAEYHGLKADVKLTQKNFTALPICVDLGLRLVKKEWNV